MICMAAPLEEEHGGGGTHLRLRSNKGTSLSTKETSPIKTTGDDNRQLQILPAVQCFYDNGLYDNCIRIFTCLPRQSNSATIYTFPLNDSYIRL